MLIRAITKNDYDDITRVLDRWWGGPSGRGVDPMFFYEFGEHALVAVSDDNLVGFLIGLVAHRSNAPYGYIHLVGIHPDHRRRGVGRDLYVQFFEHCKNLGVARVKAIAAKGHEGPMHFHRSLGFSVDEIADYAGPGRERVVFVKDL
ncbi:MAG: GNAT family N-acetyltransferase [Polyangiales bacterium]